MRGLVTDWRRLAVSLVVLAAILLGGCGHAPIAGSYADCSTGARKACLAFLDRLVRLSSIRLTADVPAQVSASCAAAARETRLKVVCPAVVPAGGAITDLSGPQIVDRRSYSVSINNGQNPGRIHWEFGAIRGPQTKLWVFDRSNWAGSLTVPPPARLISQRDYLGQVISVYRFPDNDGQLEGHDAVFATKHGVSYFVSIHGHTHDDADIAMLLTILARSP